jgi:cytosine/adenosine deaminase-related metal-dependent hydrolase
LRLCSGIPPVSAAGTSGLSIGAGLDGLALGDDADYWNELRLLRGLAQAQSGERVDATDLLDRLLAGGRRALGACAPARPAIGELADFQLLDLRGHERLLRSGHWPVADVALAAGRPQLIEEVWVAGNRVRGHGPTVTDGAAAVSVGSPTVSVGSPTVKASDEP